MSTMNVGVIGCGMLAKMTHLRHLQQFDDVNLKWVCDIDEANLLATQKVFGAELTTTDWQEVIDDPDTSAIVLATAQDLRLPVVAAAARSGKGVYCEKPVAETIAEMEQMKAVVDESGIVFCAGHNRRSAPAMVYAHDAFRRAREPRSKASWVLDRHTAGRDHWPEEDQAVLLVRINDDIRSWKRWTLAQGAMATGPMLFEMTHFTDIANWFAAAQPVQVNTTGHLRANQSATITYDDGSIATIIMAATGTFSYPKELYEFYANGSGVILDHFVEVRTADVPGLPVLRTFSCAKGEPEVNGINDYRAQRKSLEEQAEAEQHDSEWLMAKEATVDKGHRQHLTAFLDAVRGNGQSPCGIDNTMLATRVAFAAIESLKLSRPVKV